MPSHLEVSRSQGSLVIFDCLAVFHTFDDSSYSFHRIDLLSLGNDPRDPRTIHLRLKFECVPEVK